MYNLSKLIVIALLFAVDSIVPETIPQSDPLASSALQMSKPVLVFTVDSIVPETIPQSDPLASSALQMSKPVLVFTIDTDLNRPVPVIAEDFDLYFERCRVQEMYGTGAVFVAAQKKYSINAVYIMAHAAWESDWGQSKITDNIKNPPDRGIFDIAPMKFPWLFDSYFYIDSVDTVVRCIKQDYLISSGKYWGGSPTLNAMNRNYTTNENWKFEIVSIMNRFWKAGGRGENE